MVTSTIGDNVANFEIGYASMVATALHRDVGGTHRATKTVMQWTGASERTVKNWFAGTKGPSGKHLIALMSHSNTVMLGVLALAGRDQPTETLKNLADWA